MLLTRIRSRLAALRSVAIVALLWPGLALAQAQVEAVPEPPPAFDMWNLEALGDPIQLPPPPPIGLPDPLDPPPPPGWSNASDPCRHFTEEERSLLPSLCGASD
jgi:hypothetical protein